MNYTVSDKHTEKREKLATQHERGLMEGRKEQHKGKLLEWRAESSGRYVVAEMSDYLNTDEGLCLSSSQGQTKEPAACSTTPVTTHT